MRRNHFDAPLGQALVELEKSASVVVAEAQSESWITRSWRPITMLTFVGLIPAFIYIVKLERRVVRMETLLETLYKAQGGPAQLTG
ncbi:MAG: 3TM-type holin [Pseudomonadota bacterium]